MEMVRRIIVASVLQRWDPLQPVFYGLRYLGATVVSPGFGAIDSRRGGGGTGSSPGKFFTFGDQSVSEVPFCSSMCSD